MCSYKECPKSSVQSLVIEPWHSPVIELRLSVALSNCHTSKNNYIYEGRGIKITKSLKSIIKSYSTLTLTVVSDLPTVCMYVCM